MDMVYTSCPRTWAVHREWHLNAEWEVTCSRFVVQSLGVVHDDSPRVTDRIWSRQARLKARAYEPRTISAVPQNMAKIYSLKRIFDEQKQKTL